MIILSVDIGKKNFALYAQKVDTVKLKSLKKELPLTHNMYNPDGTLTPEMQEFLKKIHSIGSTLLCVNQDLTQGCDKKQTLDPLTFKNMNDVLDSHKEILDQCDIILIEEQMSFGKQINRMAMKLAQHCYSYFVFHYGNSKRIIEYPAYHKTQLLGAPKVEGKPYKSGKKRYKAMEKPQRKKWVVPKTYEILSCRNEEDIFDGIKLKSKKDDLCDTICQLESAKLKLFLLN